MAKTVDISQLMKLMVNTTEFSALGDDYAFLRITESSELPRRMDGPIRFEGIAWILCFGGRFEVNINLVAATLNANSAVVIRGDSFVELKNIDTEGLDCYMLLVSQDFVRDINFDLNILSSLPPIASRGMAHTPVIDISGSEAKLLKSYFELLGHNTGNRDMVYSKAIARNIIAALTYQLMQIISSRTPEEVVERPSSLRTGYVRDFFKLVHAHHRSERSLSFYAQKLFISTKYLSLIVKERTGRSAAEIIDDYVILEAKNLLRYSGKNVQQVSYELNFPNQSSFGKYFKHLVGKSPSEYQRSE